MLHPWMLLGLAGLAVPVILHLIQRQRLRPQMLATLQFLDVEDAANAFAPVPRDWLQLLLRLLLIGLLVLLMARLAVFGDRPGPRTMAVVLDQSASMQQKAGEEETLFDRYKAQILELIDGLEPDDRMAMVLVGDRVVHETGYLQDKDELRRIAASFDPSESGAQALVPAVRSAVRQLSVRRDVNSYVLVFSDHQRAHFQPYLEEADREAADNPTLTFRDQLSSNGVQVILVDDGPSSGDNLAIEQARFHPEQVYLGGSSRVTAVVRNHGQQAKTTRVHVALGPQAGTPRELSLEPGEAAFLDLVQRFEAPQDTACCVEIEPDVLRADDRYYMPMRIRDRKQVLLVVPAGDAPGQEAGLEFSHRGADLLAYALNPGEALGQGGGTAISVRRVTPAMFSRISLPIYSVIVLYGVTELPEQSARDLEAFVRGGGGVWLVPDRDVSPLRFNEGHARLLAGLAIGQLKEPDPVEALGRDESALASGAMLPLVRQEWGNTRDLYFARYHVLQSPGTGQIALRTASGDPLMATVGLGRGRVFVQLLDLELESSSLARTTAFVPMVQQVAALLSQRGGPPRPDVLRVGQAHRMALPELRGQKGEVDVKGPQQSRFPLTGADGTEIQVEDLLRAGVYEVSHPARSASRTRYVTVNPVLGESDLTRLSIDDQALLFGDQNVQRLPRSELAGVFAPRREILGLMALLVCVALVLEGVAGAWQARRKTRKTPRASARPGAPEHAAAMT